MTLALGFEALLALLLLLTVFYCWRLDRRLNALRNGQDGMRDAVQDLINATAKAETCILALRETTGQSSTELDERITSGRKLAAHLQQLTRQSRNATPTTSDNASIVPPRTSLMDRLREVG